MELHVVYHKSVVIFTPRLFTQTYLSVCLYCKNLNTIMPNVYVYPLAIVEKEKAVRVWLETSPRYRENIYHPFIIYYTYIFVYIQRIYTYISLYRVLTVESEWWKLYENSQIVFQRWNDHFILVFVSIIILKKQQVFCLFFFWWIDLNKKKLKKS